MKKIKFIAVFMLLGLFVAAGPSHVFAADEEDEKNMADTIANMEDEYSEEEQMIIEDIDAADYIKPIEDEYTDASIVNLSKMYWAIDKFKLDEDEAIDNYLLVNECPLFTQYFNNDFEWVKIREATRKVIKRDMENYPTQFEIIIPIHLDRYDVDKKEFNIMDYSQILGMRKLDFSNNPPFGEVCGRGGEVEGYPKNIILVLNRPFSIEKIPVHPEIAQMYLNDVAISVENLDPKLRARKYERTAFLRLKVRITKYKDTVRSIAGDMRAVVFGRIEGVEVFADRRKMKPMYISTLKDKRVRRFRQRQMGTAGGQPDHSDLQNQ